MIFSRRWASATPSAAYVPLPSGPRGASTAAIRSTAATSAPPVKEISPAMPHIGLSLTASAADSNTPIMSAQNPDHLGPEPDHLGPRVLPR